MISAAYGRYCQSVGRVQTDPIRLNNGLRIPYVRKLNRTLQRGCSRLLYGVVFYVSLWLPQICVLLNLNQKTTPKCIHARDWLVWIYIHTFVLIHLLKSIFWFYSFYTVFVHIMDWSCFLGLEKLVNIFLMLYIHRC